MRISKVLLISLCLLSVGYLLGAEAGDAPPPKDMGYSEALVGKGWTVLLIQILPKAKGDKEYAVTAKVLADLHGKIKEGTTIRIVADFVPLMGSAESNFPPDEDGDIAVWSVQEKGGGKYKYQNVQGDFPIGVDVATRIAASDINKVKAALKELRAAVETPDHAGPSRARAEELLKEKNFYLWALGAWCTARNASASDAKVIKEAFAEPDLSLAQAVWLYRVLLARVADGDSGTAISIEEANTLMRSFLFSYVKQHPGAPGSVAPATEPSR